MKLSKTINIGFENYFFILILFILLQFVILFYMNCIVIMLLLQHISLNILITRLKLLILFNKVIKITYFIQSKSYKSNLCLKWAEGIKRVREVFTCEYLLASFHTFR